MSFTSRLCFTHQRISLTICDMIGSYGNRNEWSLTSLLMLSTTIQTLSWIILITPYRIKNWRAQIALPSTDQRSSSTVLVRPASRFHSTDLTPLCAVKWTLPTRSAAPLYFCTTIMRYCVTSWMGGLCF